MNLISIKDLEREKIEEIFHIAKNFEDLEGILNEMKGKILALVFFEPSTRTINSFAVAMQRLGGSCIFHKEEGSSREKGESKLDTLLTYQQYSDIIVVRDSEKISYAEMFDIPIINAGDDAEEHPTQALLDLYTIKKHFSLLTNLTFFIFGDLKYGRTAHSLALAAEKFGCKVVGFRVKDLGLPKKFMPKDYEEYDVSEKDDIKIKGKKIFYATRIQWERIAKEKGYKINELTRNFLYSIYDYRIEKIPEDTLLLHPLPRGKEISDELFYSEDALHFEQVKNSVPVRMAILSYLLKNEQNKKSDSIGKRSAENRRSRRV